MIRTSIMAIAWMAFACSSAPPPPPAQPAAPPAEAPPAEAPPAECTATQVMEAGSCLDVAGSLQGLRWEMPCKEGSKGAVCKAKDAKMEKTTTLAGAAGQVYEVTLRFRGVVEQQTYAKGSAEELWYVGGRSANSNYNIYRLDVSDPAQTFFLNAGKHGIRHVWPIDYTKTIRVAGGATLTLSADAQDGQLIANRDSAGAPVVIEAVAPAPEPFNGQFIQMDVMSVAPAAAESP